MAAISRPADCFHHGHATSDTVRAMKAGAIEFLTKPFDPDTLLHAIAVRSTQSAFLAEQLELRHSRIATNHQRREPGVMSLCPRSAQQTGRANLESVRLPSGFIVDE